MRMGRLYTNLLPIRAELPYDSVSCIDPIQALEMRNITFISNCSLTLFDEMEFMLLVLPSMREQAKIT